MYLWFEWQDRDVCKSNALIPPFLFIVLIDIAFLGGIMVFR